LVKEKMTDHSVGVFFDGKNFFEGWKDSNLGQNCDISFPRLVDWLIKQVGGTRLWGAYYYTGIEIGSQFNLDSQARLNSFLDHLENYDGFFVKRFPRRSSNIKCPHCYRQIEMTREKEVDTTLVIDMIKFVQVQAFKTLILVSGDADYSPAVERVVELGCQVYVATWAGSGLSHRLRHVAFSCIDLCKGFDLFREPNNKDPEDLIDEFIAELKLAEEKFNQNQDGYVGLTFFITRWRAERLSLPHSPQVRRRILDAAVNKGKVEIYTESKDQNKALRVIEV